MILLINKTHLFNEEMISSFEMVEYENFNEETYYLEREAYQAFEMLKAHLQVDNIIIDLNSAYRSLETQENIFLKYLKSHSLEETEEKIAMPGTTDHHTGKALDIIIYKDGKWLTNKEDLLQEEKIFKKIHQSLKYFGFILRYPHGKEKITNHPYSPWHIRYIGQSAKDFEPNETLEEYLERNNLV